MKILLVISVFLSAFVGCFVKSATQGTVNQGAATDNNQVAGQSFNLSEQGITLTLPKDWTRDESREADQGEFGWLGPEKMELSVIVNLYKSEYGNHPIEEETDKFYQDHKAGGSEDVRLLEINGVKGVHFLPGDDEMTKVRGGKLEKDLYRSIKWASQRMYKDKRQIIFVTLTCPVSSFSKHRETLYSILNSLKFTQG